jgi:hypothetical protein
MKFPKSFLEDLVYLNEGEDLRGTRMVQKNYEYSSRWTENWNMVFEHEGAYYKVGYELPSTEMQEEIEPFDSFVEDDIECVEVAAHPVTVIEYREVVK